ncbi:MAG TPA: hypothetical protein VEW48_25915 [Thermoanaerobaculia bacterium]|nr:hypothetical protein [Thermoanaerobaculia bacterium]
MDEKRSGVSLSAPAPAGVSLHQPGRGSFPAVDDHLVVPEVTRDEIIAGRRVVAHPAEAPHGDKQVDLDTLLRVHIAPGFVASADLITRFAADSDFASDTCVRREGTDPATGRRYLEEIAFEVVSTQTERKATEKAGVMHRRGVRRIFGLWVKGQRRVCEWSGESGSWRLLDPGSSIEDPCFGAPLPVAALLDAALVPKAVVQALVAQGDPEILNLEAAAETRGEVRGEARGVARSILKILEARGIAVSPAYLEEILGCADLERLNRWLLRASEAASADDVTSAR